MRILTALPSLMLALVAMISLSSCGKSLVPPEVSGLGDLLKNATSSLQGIADVADPAAAVDKAKEALPQLTETGTQLASIEGLMAKLPEPAKAIVTRVLGEYGPKIEELIAKVTSIPGVGDVVKGPVDKIKASLSALSAS